MTKSSAEQLLTPTFPKKHVAAMLRHFDRMTEDFQRGEWENCIAKGGKFVEAALKALYARAGQVVPAGRAFGVDFIINGLSGLAAGSVDDTVRITIPRACRFVYEIASNRGGRHDPDEVDPNEMDTNAVAMNCSWVLAEMIRHATKGAVDLGQAKEIVDSLVERKYPFIEEVEGRMYFHFRKKTAPDVALLALARRHPKRIEKQELIETVKRNGFTDANARMAVKNIARFVDNDGQDRLRALATGLRKAERVMKEKSQ
jgi:hypothetical protein